MIATIAPAYFEETLYSLSTLLPYDLSVKVGDRLNDGLKEFVLLLISAELAIQSLMEGHYTRFDSLVGENACQIRAVKLALIFSKPLPDYSGLLRVITATKDKVKALSARSHGLLKDGTSLQSLLESEDIDIKLSSDEMFLIKAYLLSKVKILKPFKEELPLVENAYTDTKKIKEISDVGSAFAHNLVRKLREMVSENSVAFVQKIAALSPSAETVSNKYRSTHRGLQVLPYYWMTRVLMEHALACRIPIVVIAEQKAKDQNYVTVKKTVLFFQPTAYGYQETMFASLHPNMPAIYFLGSTCREFRNLSDDATWRNELIERGPVDLILAYAAKHRQYPDKSISTLLKGIEDGGYEYYKTNAQKWGCTAENASCFFLSHAFCDKIENVKMHL